MKDVKLNFKYISYYVERILSVKKNKTFDSVNIGTWKYFHLVKNFEYIFKIYTWRNYELKTTTIFWCKCTKNRNR